MAATGIRQLAALPPLLGLAGIFVAAAGGEEGGLAKRCGALVALFDEIQVSRFDYRLLAIENVEFAQARALRRQAEEDCAAGRYRFGVDAIEEALLRLGVVPPVEPDGAGRGPQR